MNKKGRERDEEQGERNGDGREGNVRCRGSHDRAGDGLAMHATFQPTKRIRTARDRIDLRKQ